MKKFISILLGSLFSLALMAQTPFNYKEGDFTGKQIKSKTVLLDNRWEIKKNSSTNALTFYYMGTAVGTFSSDGVFTPTSVTATALTTSTLNVTSTITSSALTRGNSAFTTNETRVKVLIPGITNTSFVIVQPVAPSGSSRPVAGDVLSTFIVNDTLIVQRQAGTTSGGSFDWFRIK